jgi:hypothetical protein
MADDWNISRSWKEEMRRAPWWRERLVGGLMTYWIYQHIGNLAPVELERHAEYEAVRRADDGGAELRESVEWVDSNGEGKVWSFKRDLGGTRLVVVDDRTGRSFHEGRRSIFDDHEWDWIVQACNGDFDHLLFATTDPVLLAPGLHYAEAWNEAVCDGAWGDWAVAPGEKLRRALDLDHWAAFHMSFKKLEGLLREVARGRARPPARIDRPAIGRRPPCLPGRGRLPPRSEGPKRRLPGRLLAVPERPRYARTADRSPCADPSRHRRDPRARAGGRRPRPRDPVAPDGRALLRQPGGDDPNRRSPRLHEAREDGR